jgi:hypothetical protein
MLGCCQGLISPGLEFALTKVKFSPVALGIQLIGIERLSKLADLPAEKCGPEYDTGPPTQSCFVRTVLKRSLRENAPPYLA